MTINKNNQARSNNAGTKPKGKATATSSTPNTKGNNKLPNSESNNMSTNKG